MSVYLPRFVDPVEVAVSQIVSGTHLSTGSIGFVPVIRLEDIQEGDKLPLVTCETLDYLIEPDGINASVGYLITIWDYFPDRQNCSTLEQLHLLAVRVTKGFTEDLLEISNLLGGPNSETYFPDAEYRTEGQRIILPRYKEDLWESKVDAKHSPMRDRLLGASIQGRLKGIVPHICCSSSNAPFGE